MRLQRADVPPLYALTAPLQRLSLVEQVSRLSDAGVRWVQIREKNSCDLVLWRELERLKAAAPQATLFVNDRTDLALAADVHGVHLGDEDLPASVARGIAPALIIGVSTHDEGQAVAAAEADDVDYVAIGPVFKSPTKDVRAPLGLSVIERIRARVTKPLIAIGGIDSSNIADVLAAGADSAAVISALYADDAVEQNVERLFTAIDRRR